MIFGTEVGRLKGEDITELFTNFSDDKELLKVLVSLPLATTEGIYGLIFIRELELLKLVYTILTCTSRIYDIPLSDRLFLTRQSILDPTTIRLLASDPSPIVRYALKNNKKLPINTNIMLTLEDVLEVLKWNEKYARKL
jgi:hypothetical protein